jgi:small subunit ribosomal protein S8
MSKDSISDFLTIIRNGIMRAKPFVVAPCSNLKINLLEILKNEGFIKDFVVIDMPGNKKDLKVFLKYSENESVIHDLKRVSKPGRRFYAASDELKPVIGGLGISILSTSRGLMTNKQAKELGIGGEILCTVW